MLYSKAQREELLSVALLAIQYGVSFGTMMKVEHENITSILLEPGASFVTLKTRGKLRGCIGSLHSTQPLYDNVAANAYKSAFNDYRFRPLNAGELEHLHIQISVLNKSQAMEFNNEESLIRQLRPKIDGLTLDDNNHHATFLPAVWNQLQEPQHFLEQLKIKAGLDPDYWSDSLQISRYTVESFDNGI